MKLERGELGRAKKNLIRRYDWLTERVTLARTPISFDLSERIALKLCIGIITALIEGQKVEVSSDRSNRPTSIA